MTPTILVESMIWQDRNLKFGPNYDLEEDNWEKNLKFDSAILDSDPARSYFPLKEEGNSE